MHGHRVLSSLPDEAIDALVSHGEAPLVSVELRHLGGALGRGSVCHGAANRLHGAYSLFAIGIIPDAESAMAVDAACTRLTDALDPWDAGRAILNFSDRPARHFDGYTVHRLRTLKSRLDGDGVFAGPRSKGRLKGSDPFRRRLGWWAPSSGGAEPNQT